MKFSTTIALLFMTATVRAALVGASAVATNHTTTAGSSPSTQAPAVHFNRFAALSMLESGDDDHAVGAHGEVSRYQILPRYWIEGNPHDARIALANAKAIMTVRCAIFERRQHRPATDFEFYILWNAQSQINHPNPAVAERAQRFANLCQR